MKKSLLYISFLFLINLAFGQGIDNALLSASNKELVKQLVNEENQRIHRVNSYVTQNRGVQSKADDGFNSRYIYDIVDGVVLYKATHNLGAARSTGTSDLQVGGSLGLNLDGSDMTLGIWDFGPVDTTHPEFANTANSGSRVQNVDIIGVDKSTDYDNHATHVTGTMAAMGVDNKSKGMAPNINVKSYNWTNDKTEMVAAANAKTNPIILSNHSYGVPLVGDDDNKLPAWYMGAYTKDARDIDEISRNNPKYLIVTSSGNDGSTNYDDGLFYGHDKLTTDKNAKNNLVVANATTNLDPVNFNVISLRINKSSSQGPTDDLRIKPDLTGHGTNVYSTIAEGKYAKYSGTSMAAPNVAGTLALIQQYYLLLHGEYMNASTLKGLVCHTAVDDNLKMGPDPIFGWGFLDARTSAETILAATSGKAIVDELSLEQGSAYTITFAAQAGDKLKASISWTDMPGEISKQILNDPTPRLVNDLDLRVSKDGDTFLPWKLNYSPESGFSSSKGDNNVDNIEVVEIEAPSSGVYTLTVTHKGTLKGDQNQSSSSQNQDFSLIVTGNNVVLGTKENILSNNLSVFPNPNNGEFTISFDALENTNENVNVAVYDVSGRLVYKNKFDNNALHFHQAIKLKNASPGIYIANISKGSSTTSHKIIIK